MANWYLDHLASGTGSGDTPANAFTNINSAWSIQSSWFTRGDILWVRRTHVSTVASTNAGRIGQAWDAGSHYPYSGMIGWPSAGQPFFDVRPTEAISAGWDADTNSAYPTINMPAMVSSFSIVTIDMFLQEGMVCANMIWHNRSANKHFIPASNPYIVKSNLHLIGYTLNAAAPSMVDDVTLTLSHNGAFLGNSGGWMVEAQRITLSASCFCPIAIVEWASQVAIGQIVNQSNSVHAMTSQGGFLNGAYRSTIESIRGTKPKRDVTSRGHGGTNWFGRPLIINDWFGEGPRTIAPQGSRSHITPSSADITVNSRPALAASYVYSCSLFQWDIQRGRSIYGGGPVADARAFVNYSNGIPLVVRWPIMMTQSAQPRPDYNNLPAAMRLTGQFAEMAYCNTFEVSSGFTWAGNSTSAGSFWVAKFSITPTEAGSGFVDLYLQQARSREGLIAIGMPEVNSA